MSLAAPYLIFILAALVFMLVGGLLQVLAPMQAALIGAQLLGLGGVALYVRRVRPAPPRGWPAWSLGLPIKTLALLLLIAPCLAILANTLGALTLALIPSLEPSAKAYREATLAMLYPEQPWLRALALISVVGTAPLCEELLFRGAILPEQRRAASPPWLALGLNGALFGLLHMNPISALALTLLGVFLAHLTWMTGRLGPAILVHALVNLTNGVVLAELSQAQALDLEAARPPLMQLLGLTALLSALGALLWTLIARTYTRDRPTDLDAP